ncbi:DUF397 domain-containing protein [Streptomyces sp. NPDC050610]|uniref:DUF397 domain-containing protein n=1 Tax=Streptomyces sp. NPDC050610 TaxID=3157097 RepID=UPI003430A015
MRVQKIPDASAVAAWRKSSYSENVEGACIEVSDGYPAGVPVRDSKDPHGPAIVFETAAWSSFLAAVKGGRFPV